MAKTVVGVFDDYGNAERAANALEEAGFSRSEISMMASESVRDEYVGTEGGVTKRDTGKKAATGAGIGAGVGGVAGLLVGVGALAIPGIGPIVAAGPIATTLAGAGIGAAAGGAIGALTSLGVPKQDAEHFAEAIRRGSTLVAVRADTDAEAERAAEVMNDFGAIDIDERSATWRQRGYTGFDATAEPLSRDELIGERASIPVVEEQLEVGKREVARGGVRVYTHVSEVPVSEDVRLREERAVVERHAVDRPATAAELEGFVEGEIEVTERGEVPVVAKTARVVEEVTVGKEVEERTETIRDTVRRTDVDVERTGGARVGRFESVAADFREDFDRNYAGRKGMTWETYQPAYRHGYELANDPSFAGREWDDAEMDVRTRWEGDQPGTWDSMKDAIRHAWGRARGTMARDRGAQPRR